MYSYSHTKHGYLYRVFQGMNKGVDMLQRCGKSDQQPFLIRYLAIIICEATCGLPKNYLLFVNEHESIIMKKKGE